MGNGEVEVRFFRYQTWSGVWRVTGSRSGGRRTETRPLTHLRVVLHSANLLGRIGFEIQFQRMGRAVMLYQLERGEGVLTRLSVCGFRYDDRHVRWRGRRWRRHDG